MSWSEDADQMAAEVQEAFGRDILYSDASLSSPATLVCPVGHERIERRKTQWGVEAVAVRDVFVLDDDQRIRLDGVITIDGVRYSVEGLHPRIGSRTQVICRRTTAVEKTRSRYRG